MLELFAKRRPTFLQGKNVDPLVGLLPDFCVGGFVSVCFVCFVFSIYFIDLFELFALVVLLV